MVVEGTDGSSWAGCDAAAFKSDVFEVWVCKSPLDASSEEPSTLTVEASCCGDTPESY